MKTHACDLPEGASGQCSTPGWDGHATLGWDGHAMLVRPTNRSGPAAKDFRLSGLSSDSRR